MADKFTAAIVAKIKRILKERGLLQTDLAKLMDVKPPTVTNMLRGNPIKTDSLGRIAVALGVDPCELLCEAKPKKK
jgi:transcriptional regulator with XRE-family HTH domain